MTTKNISEVIFSAQKLTREIVSQCERLIDQGVQVEIRPIDMGNGDCETPFAWDAGFCIEHNKRTGEDELRISGAAGASGYGSVEIKVPLNDCSQYEVVINAFNSESKDVSIPENILAMAWAEALDKNLTGKIKN